MAADLETIREEYKASLKDLTFNSKPIITNLTIIAQENNRAASVIVEAIEEQMRNTPSHQKLPILYLMDSICKNVGGAYPRAFAMNIVSTFTSAYQQVTQEDQLRFKRVLQTWRTHPGGIVFPLEQIAQIEAFVGVGQQQQQQGGGRRMSGEGKVYVNPNFVQTYGHASNRAQVLDPRQRRQTPYDRPSGSASSGASHGRTSYSGRNNTYTSTSHYQNGSSTSSYTAPMPTIPQAPIFDPAQTLLQQQVQLALAQKQAVWAMTGGQDVTVGQQVGVLQQLSQVLSSEPIAPLVLAQIAQQIQAMIPVQQPVQLPLMTSTPPTTPGLGAFGTGLGMGMMGMGLSGVSSSGSMTNGLGVGIEVPVSAPVVSSVPLGSLGGALDGLLDTFKWGAGDGMGVATPTGSVASVGVKIEGVKIEEGHPQPHTQHPEPTAPTPTIANLITSLPRIPLTTSALTAAIPGAVETLYDALDLQCKQCGTRYMRNEEGKAKMGKHLDWHFRMNRRAKERGKKAVSREWYLKEEEWVVEREGMSGFGEGKAPTVFFDGLQSSSSSSSQQPTASQEAVSNIPAENEKESRCAVCQEALEKFYDDEREEWMLRGVVKVDGVLYHQTCRRDLEKKNLEVAEKRGRSRSPAVEGGVKIEGAVKAEKGLGAGDDTAGGKSPVLGKRKLEDQAIVKVESGTEPVVKIEAATTVTSVVEGGDVNGAQQQQNGVRADALASLGLGGVDPAVLAALVQQVGGGEGWEGVVKRMKMMGGSG
ncbi:hypothetical protein HDV00_010551 [Rhizophlyctis rosea]|nr:hypothetical protein HDV00_010551 [Rhizophlyctis rosea]